MAENIIISTTNYVDASTSTLTVDSESSTLPKENLQNLQIVRIFRTGAVTSLQIDVDFGSSKLVDLMSIINHNFTISASIRWRLSNASDFSSSLYDSGTVDVWPAIEDFGSSPWGIFTWGSKPTQEQADLYTANVFAILSSATVARYMRIEISDSTNTDGYLQAGRLIAGPAYQPTINYANGVEFEFVDESRVTKSRGGQTFVDEVEKFRRLRFDLINLPEDEIFGNVFNSLDRIKGISKDVLVIPQPSEPTTWITQNIYGRISATAPIVNSALTFYGRQIEIEEMI
jgi:hypothetical protein